MTHFSDILLPLLQSGASLPAGTLPARWHAEEGLGAADYRGFDHGPFDHGPRQLRLLKDEVASRVAAFARPEQQVRELLDLRPADPPTLRPSHPPTLRPYHPTTLPPSHSPTAADHP